MTYPVCPHCRQAMIRIHEQDYTTRRGWRVVWLCACQPDPEIVKQMERKIQTLQHAGTNKTILGRKQWVRS